MLSNLLWHKTVNWSNVSDFILTILLLIVLCILVVSTALLILAVPVLAVKVISLAFDYHWTCIFLLILEYPLIGVARFFCKILNS